MAPYPTSRSASRNSRLPRRGPASSFAREFGDGAQGLLHGVADDRLHARQRRQPDDVVGDWLAREG
ncbi:MAG: hypothetical protein DLM58_11130 [Pseudonocardiales bacterium]|nr:MAG: hypothetical protein DLM58_11130 [Pseudonocardiales bacterium]